MDPGGHRGQMTLPGGRLVYLESAVRLIKKYNRKDDNVDDVCLKVQDALFSRCLNAQKAMVSEWISESKTIITALSKSGSVQICDLVDNADNKQHMK